MRNGVGAVLVAALLAACGRHRGLEPRGDGGPAAGEEDGGRTVASDAGGRAAPDARVTSSCRFNEPGPSRPRIQVRNPGPLIVGCEGEVTGTFARVSDEGGQGFDWYPNLEPSLLSPITLSTGPGASACPAQLFSDATVTARAAFGSRPGDHVEARLTITTTNPAIAPVDIPVSAQVVPLDFSLNPSAVDFGDVPVGTAVDVYIEVTNLSSASIAW